MANSLRELRVRAERVALTRRAIEQIRGNCNNENENVQEEKASINNLGNFKNVPANRGRVDYAMTVKRLQEKLANKQSTEVSTIKP